MCFIASLNCSFHGTGSSIPKKMTAEWSCTRRFSTKTKYGSTNKTNPKNIFYYLNETIKMYSNPSLFIMGVIVSILAGIHSSLFAILEGNVIPMFTKLGDEFREMISYYLPLMIMVVLYCMITMYFFDTIMTKLVEGLIKAIRINVFTNILSQEVGFFDHINNTPSSLSNILARYPSVVKNIAGVHAGYVLMAVSSLISVILISFSGSWKIGLTLLAMLPVVLFVCFIQSSINYKLTKKESSAAIESSKLASECVHHIKTVQSFCLQEYMVKAFMQHLATAHRNEGKHQFMYGVTHGLMKGMLGVMFIPIHYIGSKLLDEGVIKSSDIFSLGNAIPHSVLFISFASFFIIDLGKGMAKLKTIIQLMQRRSELDPLSSEGDFKDIKGKLELRDVWFEYPTRRSYHVLKGIDLTIEPGQTVALVGGSGCGKSTVVALLERFYIPHKGNILIDNMDISAINVGHLRNNLGLVTQEPTLFDRTIRDNIAYGAKSLDREVTEQEIIEAAMAANIHEFIISLPQGYETVVGENGTKLSGGQKQRIAIARALIRNPKILLLDEATSALDAESEKVVQEALDNAREGRTCIIIAHRLSTIKNADKIVVIHNGVVAEQGTHDELKELGGLYYDLIKHQ